MFSVFKVVNYGMAVAVIMLSATISSAQTIYPTSNTLKEAVNNLDQGIRETETVVLSGPNNTYDEETPDGYRVTKGDLTIYQDKDNRGIISGSLGADGASSDEKVSLTLYGIGTAEINTATGTASNVDNYWTNLQNGQTQATDSALLATNADLSITGVVFANSNNVTADTIWGNGGAMRMNENTTADIQQSLFYNNKTQRYGGAIDVDNETAIITNLQDNAFINNSAALHGGALDVDGAIQSMSGNVFSGNTAGSGGAMYVDGGSVTGTGNTFMNNTATENGGALYNALGTATLTDTTFTGNSAQEGGAVYNTGETSFEGTTQVTGNNATDGAGIYNATHGILTLSGTVNLENNTATENGGALYNAGNLYVTGNDITIANNKADLGTSLYNAVGGRATFSDVNDEVDLDNESGTTGHTIFDQAGTIYNAGILDFINSTIQLHNGINTDAVLSDLSSRRVGTVNMQGSSIDLGGVDTEGTGILYADTLNISNDSTLRSHIGMLTDPNPDNNKYGSVSANTVSITGNNTLSLILPFWAKLGTNETRDYQILDADTINGEFSTLNNNLYDVYALGDGTYRITTKTNCQANATYDLATDSCVCNTGYVEVGGVCELKTTCGANEVYDEATNTCSCASGYVEVGGVCELKVTCGANEVYDEETNTCSCASGYVEVNGVCELKTTCGANEVYDEETNTCSCASGYVEVNGVCELKTTCGANEVYDEETNTCSCASGYVEVNGVCELKTTCGANEVYDEETNSCQCASGYVEVNGSCEAQITCGENADYDLATNTCRCRSGYEMVGEACLAACTGGKIRVGTECKCPNGQVEVNGVCQTKTDTTDYCPGCDENEKATANGWLQGTEMVGNELAQKIQNDLFEKFQEEGASMSYREALDGLAPDVTPLIEAHATEITRRLSAIVSERFYNSNAYTGYQHNGYRFYNFPRKQSNLWAQGLYGKSKYDNRKGFDMDSHGIAMGFDGHVSEALKLGAAYAYTQFDGDSVGRDTEIDSHSAMVYATYNPSKFYANWMGMYTRSTFDEEKKVLSHIVDADYDVDVLATQLMLGYKMDPIVVGNWASGVFKPEIGARYIWTRQHAYTDTAGQHVSSADGSTLTGILGTQYSVTYRLTPSVSWYPVFRAAVTYDFVQPDTEMSVGLVNGSSYRVTTEKNTERVGIELGAKIGLNVGEKTEVGLEYEGLFKGDYTNHTGMANLKYKF